MDRRTIAIVCFVLATFGFFLGWQSHIIIMQDSAALEITAETEENVASSKTTLDFTPLLLVWDVLQEHYIDAKTLDVQTLIYGAARGFVEAVNDPYTVFMTPAESAEFQNDLNGDLEGIGVEVTIANQTLVVVNVLKNSPAEEEGLKSGDILYAIDDKLTGDMTFYEALKSIKGKPGTEVKVTVIRENEPEPLNFVITRERIMVPSVDWNMKENGIAYISVNQFSDNTLSQFYDAVSGAILQDPQGVIIDLRSNGGGYLDIAVGMLSEFIEDKQNAVTIERSDPLKNENVYVSGTARMPDLPIVVLINGDSASASEIFAGAIQDYKRGFLIGEQSYGKGSVQEIQSLEDGSSLRLTVARWLTPNGRSINHVGLTPDLTVELTDEDRTAEKDPQLEAAITYLTDLMGNTQSAQE